MIHPPCIILDLKRERTVHFDTSLLEGRRKKRKDSTSVLTADTNLLKMVHVEILLIFINYFRPLQLGFWKFLSGIVFLHYQVRTIGLFFLQAHSIWQKPRAFNPDKKSIGTPKFYCVLFVIHPPDIKLDPFCTKVKVSKTKTKT